MKKKPFFLSTYILAIVLFIVAVCITNNALSTSLCLCAILLFFISLWLSVVKFFKWIFGAHKPDLHADIPEPVQEPAPNPLKVAPHSDESQVHAETHKVAGTSFRRDALESIGTLNCDYDLSPSEALESYDYGDRIYEYEFYAHPALVPEPDNPHSPNAIRVEADGVHIGYIKSGSAAHIHKLMDSNRIKSMDIEIGGGRYKELEETDDERPILSRDRTEYWARLTIYVT